jgi:hypothetical protein
LPSSFAETVIGRGSNIRKDWTIAPLAGLPSGMSTWTLAVRWAVEALSSTASARSTDVATRSKRQTPDKFVNDPIMLSPATGNHSFYTTQFDGCGELLSDRTMFRAEPTCESCF